MLGGTNRSSAVALIVKCQNYYSVTAKKCDYQTDKKNGQIDPGSPDNLSHISRSVKHRRHKNYH